MLLDLNSYICLYIILLQNMIKTIYFKRENLIILIFLFLLNVKMYGGNLRQITNKDGLSNSSILSIQQDEEGFLWFGTCDGLNLFNGVNIQTLNHTNDNFNLAGNLIEKVIEAEKNVLWIHTNYGLSRYHKETKTLENFNQFRGLYFLEKDQYNTIFIIDKDNKIYYYHRPTKTFKTLVMGDIYYNSIVDFSITSNNQIEIITQKKQHLSYQIEYRDDGQINLRKAEPFKHHTNIKNAFHEQNASNILYFIDENDVLYEYNFLSKKKHFIHRLNKEINEKGVISAIIKFNDDYIIGFKTNGVICLKYQSDKSNDYITQEIDIHVGVFCLTKDINQDLVWIGTDGQGVFMYSNDIYKIQSYEFINLNHNINKPIRSLFLDTEKTLWIGTKGDGIVKIDDYSFDKPLHTLKPNYIRSNNSQLLDNQVYTFANSDQDILWIGTEYGLNYYSYKDRAIKNAQLEKDGKKIHYVHGICEVNDSTLFIATVGEGIVIANVKWTKDIPSFYNLKHYTVHNGIEYNNYFFTIFDDNKHNQVWFGNRGNGAYIYDLNTDNGLKNIRLNEENTPPTINDIFAITRDKQENIWFGTSYGLIKYLPDGSIKIYNQQSGFPNNTIHAILADEEDNLWVSTNKGIVCFDTQNETTQIYNQKNGVKIIEYSDGATFFDSETKNMFFGGINGFITISKSKEELEAYLPEIYLTNLNVYGKNKNINEFLSFQEGVPQLKLSYNENFFNLSFNALDYLYSNNYTYSYYIENISKQWVDNGYSNTLSFTSLAPGNYKLQVKYINNFTGIESPIFPVNIQITPPWYKSSTAYALYYLLTISLTFYAIRELHKRNERKRKRALDKMEQSHQKEVYESKLNFFTNVAQEFCTPLTLIYGPCHRILSSPETTNLIKQYTELIQYNAKRMNSLIQSLITFKKVESGLYKPNITSSNISNLIDEVYELYNSTAHSKNIIFTKNSLDNCMWNTDENFLYLILMNLLSYNFNHTENRGIITLTLEFKENILDINIDCSPTLLTTEEIQQFFKGHQFLDNFEKQIKTKSDSIHELELAISFHLIDSLKGTITIYKNEETVHFHISLPTQKLSEGENSSYLTKQVSDMKFAISGTPNLIQQKEMFNPTKHTLLIINDNEELIWLLKDIFQEDYNIVTLGDISLLEHFLENFYPDLILADTICPSKKHISIIKEVKDNKKTSHIPFIFISADNSVEEQIEILSSGVEMYIIKPFNPEYLKTSVDSLLARKKKLKDYFNSALSAYDLKEGQLTHKEDTRLVQQILDIINENINNPKLDNKLIADKLNISSRHLYRKLKEIGESSPTDMIKECRMHMAHNLLVHTQLTINEIIYKCGYNNRSTFYRIFFEKYDCTPTEYRENSNSEKNIS